jgi:hypothetical protein
MKILYLMTKEPDDTCRTFIEEHRKTHDVSILEINENSDYEAIVDAIVSCDKVISW